MTMRIALLVALLLATGISAAIGDVSLYRWAKNGGAIWLLGSYILWMLSVTFFGVYLRWGEMTFSFAIILAMIVQIAIVTVYDATIVKAQITPMRWAAIVLGVISLVLYELGDKPSG